MEKRPTLLQYAVTEAALTRVFEEFKGVDPVAFGVTRGLIQHEMGKLKPHRNFAAEVPDPLTSSNFDTAITVFESLYEKLPEIDKDHKQVIYDALQTEKEFSEVEEKKVATVAQQEMIKTLKTAMRDTATAATLSLFRNVTSLYAFVEGTQSLADGRVGEAAVDGVILFALNRKRISQRLFPQRKGRHKS